MEALPATRTKPATRTPRKSVGSDKSQSSDKSHTFFGFLSHFELKKGFKTSNFGIEFPTPKVNGFTAKKRGKERRRRTKLYATQQN